MKQYLSLAQHVLETGELVENRTDTKAYATFGGQMKFDLSEGFPLLTTKKVNFHAIVVELLWFIQGNTNIRDLLKHNVNIWNEWPYQKYTQNPDNPPLSFEEFIAKIKDDEEFAQKHGDLGPVYGRQWRNCHGVDQLAKVINEIKTNPSSRRLIVSSWTPDEVDQMLLPPCHCLFQFNVIGNKLSCHLYQRSADLFLGVPFNIASYSLLTILIAKVTNLEPGFFVHSFGNLHIYENHVEQIRLQLTRETLPLSKIVIKNHHDNIEDYTLEDIELVDYQSHPPIKAPVAV